MLERKRLSCDLCVVGAGMAGMTAAISAAREGLNVVLMHERPVLGGNASSEIRMWICGALGENNRETGIIEEIALENLYRNPTKKFSVWDTVLYDFVRREKNITLLLNCACMDAQTEKGDYPYGRKIRIKSVTGYQMTTQCFYTVEAKFFCDSSGDSILAPLCDANFRIGREGSDEFGEMTTTKEPDSMTMGMSCLIQGVETASKVDYIPPEWSKKLTAEDIKNRRPNVQRDSENFWYLELGGNKDTIADTESLRDELVSLSLGMWDYVKNSGEFDTEKWDLDFVGFLPGKRESRRMCGEYMITQRDISEDRVFPDEIAYGGWPLDDHYPGGFYHKGSPNTNYATPSNYSIPYRALYSENVDNLYFAGRNISMTHMAMSSIRVMATCSLLGEAVGKASFVAVKYGYTPHDVYLNAIEEVQTLLMNEDCFLPSKKRKISECCEAALLTGGDDRLRDGKDRPHAIYGTDENNCAVEVSKGTELSYSFTEAQISSVHIVFCSDINRTTLPGSSVERTHSTRANVKLSAVQMHMPKTLCKSFELYAEKDGIRTKLLSVENNRKRSYHLKLSVSAEKLILIPMSDWGNNEKIKVVSFDFV